MTRQVDHPPFDGELASFLAALGDELPSTITADMIAALRERQSFAPPLDELTKRWGVSHREVAVPGFEGDAIVVSVFDSHRRTAPGPAFLYLHGGGMMLGDRFWGVETALEWVDRHSGTCISVEYRKAPEFGDPYPVEDCYAALLWTVEQAAPLGIDPARLVIAGSSAGGGLAAGTVLLARDRGGPRLLGQVLMSPMLDDRNETVSSHQFQGIGVWDRTSNLTGWTALLGGRRGSDSVTSYAAPARATDLAGLPATYVDCGSAEVFRDEDAAYASAIWAAGGIAELHVWAGGFHGFDALMPAAALSQAAVATRSAWVDRLLTG